MSSDEKNTERFADLNSIINAMITEHSMHRCYVQEWREVVDTYRKKNKNNLDKLNQTYLNDIEMLLHHPISFQGPGTADNIAHEFVTDVNRLTTHLCESILFRKKSLCGSIPVSFMVFLDGIIYKTVPCVLYSPQRLQWSRFYRKYHYCLKKCTKEHSYECVSYDEEYVNQLLIICLRCLEKCKPCHEKAISAVMSFYKAVREAYNIKPDMEGKYTDILRNIQ